MPPRSDWLRSANYSRMPLNPRVNPASPHARGLVRAFALSPANPMVDLGPIGGVANYRKDTAASALRAGEIPGHGPATNFDGQNGLSFNTFNFPLASGPLTMFIRCVTAVVNSDFHYLMTSGNAPTGAIHLMLANNNSFTLANYVSGGFTIAGFTPTIGLPYDICGTCDAAFLLKLYVNAALIGSTTSNQTFSGATSTIGTAPLSTTEDNNWVGSLQDARWYNRTWAPEEIRTLSDPETAYALYYPSRPMFWDVGGAAGGTFKPAWAARANNLIGGGAWA